MFIKMGPICPVCNQADAAKSHTNSSYLVVTLPKVIPSEQKPLQHIVRKWRTCDWPIVGLHFGRCGFACSAGVAATVGDDMYDTFEGLISLLENKALSQN